MPRGDKSAYTDKQKRKAAHIEEGYENRGVSEDEARRRAVRALAGALGPRPAATEAEVAACHAGGARAIFLVAECQDKEAPDKVALAAVLKTATGVTNRWLADRLAMGAPASVSQFVRRFQRRDSHKSAIFKRALSIVKP